MAPAATPKAIDKSVMVCGVTPKRCHSKAKASPTGRVKYTSIHSSVSSDFMEAFSSSPNVLFSIFMSMFLATPKCSQDVSISYFPLCHNVCFYSLCSLVPTA